MLYRRNNAEEVVPEETKVWECVADDCKGWIRDNFTSSDDQKCPLCGSEMKAGTRMLQAINNPKNY
nr:cold-shock protein [Peribacillus asahii]